MGNLSPLEIYINHIEKEGETIHGIAAWDKTVEENLSIIFRNDKVLEGIRYLIKNSAQPFYTFTRFCQFIIYIQFQPTLGLSMKLTDFNNNIDSALEYYSDLKNKEWKKEDIDKILTIFQDIQNDRKNIAKMVIKDAITHQTTIDI